MRASLRAAVIVAGLLVLFTVCARTIWMRSAGTAVAYELRRLREEEAELRNHNDVLEVDAARRRTGSALVEAREKLELEGLEKRGEQATENAPLRAEDRSSQ